MTRDDIIRMAREAGAAFDHMTWVERDLAPVFERFAALVAAQEREACAQFLESGVDLKGLAGEPQMQAFCGALLMGCASSIRKRGDA